MGHVHMLDLDRPSHPRIRKSACKDCKAREARIQKLEAVVESYVASGPTNEELRQMYADEHNENARLRRALREIADKPRYGCCSPLYPDAPPCAHNIARQALKEGE